MCKRNEVICNLEVVVMNCNSLYDSDAKLIVVIICNLAVVVIIYNDLYDLDAKQRRRCYKL